MDREYWIYQERTCADPWSMMLIVETAEDNEKPRYILHAFIYCDALSAKHALIVSDMRFRRVWQFAARIGLAMSGQGLEVTIADLMQLEQGIADIFEDFTDREITVFYNKRKDDK